MLRPFVGWIFPFLSKLGFIPLDNIKELRKTEAERGRMRISRMGFSGVGFNLSALALLCSQQCGQAGARDAGVVSVFIYCDSVHPPGGPIALCDPVDSLEINKKRESVGGVANIVRRKILEILFYAFHKQFKRRHVRVYGGAYLGLT